ncbi:hypothetical protein Tco_1140803 [Tanacetum coccineum]
MVRGSGEEGLDQLENCLSLSLSLETEVNGSIITPYKAGGYFEAVSLPSGRGKTIYISQPPIPCGRRAGYH